MNRFTSLPVGTRIIVTVFLLSGVGHLVNPDLFSNLIPPFLPAPLFWIYASGVAEIIFAIGLLMRLMMSFRGVWIYLMVSCSTAIRIINTVSVPLVLFLMNN